MVLTGRGSCHQREALLGEVVILGEHLADPMRSHAFHGAAIREAVAFVQAGGVKREGTQKRISRLRQYLDLRAVEKALNGSNCAGSHSGPEPGKKGQELAKHLVSGDQA